MLLSPKHRPADRGAAIKAVDPARQPGLRIAQVYLAHANFSYRDEPLTLPTPVAGLPVQMDVDVEVHQLASEQGPAAGVRVRVRSKPDSPHPYVFDVAMGAIVHADIAEANYDPEQYVTTAGVTLLFPFLREAVANLTMRGRFGAIWIPPFNVKLATEAPSARTENRQ